MAPKRVVYVSCDPATLARDLKRFSNQGFRIEKAVAIDLFCRTAHVETIALLQKSNRKSKPDTYVKVSSDMEDYYRIMDQEK